MSRRPWADVVDQPTTSTEELRAWAERVTRKPHAILSAPDAFGRRRVSYPPGSSSREFERRMYAAHQLGIQPSKRRQADGSEHWTFPTTPTFTRATNEQQTRSYVVVRMAE